MGHNKAIGSPDELWSLFVDFEQNLKENPIIKSEYNMKAGCLVEIPLERPLTWSRFDCYVNDLGIITDLEDYRQNRDNRYSDYGGVVTRINKKMYSDKFEGAAVGIYNHNLIARDLGLQDKQQTEHTGEIIVRPPKFD